MIVIIGQLFVIFMAAIFTSSGIAGLIVGFSLYSAAWIIASISYKVLRRFSDILFLIIFVPLPILFYIYIADQINLTLHYGMTPFFTDGSITMFGFAYHFGLFAIVGGLLVLVRVLAYRFIVIKKRRGDEEIDPGHQMSGR